MSLREKRDSTLNEYTIIKFRLLRNDFMNVKMFGKHNKEALQNLSNAYLHSVYCTLTPLLHRLTFE